MISATTIIILYGRLLFIIIVVIRRTRVAPHCLPAKVRATSARQCATHVRDDRLLFGAIVHATRTRYPRFPTDFHSIKISLNSVSPVPEETEVLTFKNCLNNKRVLEYLARTYFRNYPIFGTYCLKSKNYTISQNDLKMSLNNHDKNNTSFYTNIKFKFNSIFNSTRCFVLSICFYNFHL